LNEDEPDDRREKIKSLAQEEALRLLRSGAFEEWLATKRNLHEAIREATERYLAFAYALVADLKTLSGHLQVSANILHASQLPAHKSHAATIRRTVEALAIHRRDRLETILATLPPPDSAEKTAEWVDNIARLDSRNQDTFTDAVLMGADRHSQLQDCARQTIPLLREVEGEEAASCSRELVRLIPKKQV
jgi:hypothetical protein